ncbi:glycosyltransferase [Pedobacter agri]|uniref:glycosyltransferase n=1 Tax=Pedobacter agri TaxID=454586 RepID=UPI00292CAAFF|nr:glycosyltransferase [Pedobacter agri]
MKRVLIISPYFAPSNAADMQRVRTSLPYLKQFGWNADVVSVEDRFSDMVKDNLLSSSIPKNTKLHRVAAFPKKWTTKIGLGSIALRSLLFYRKYVNHLLKTEQFDLIYFSTTQFPVLILGSYWKKKFNIPYVIDMQDPWHSEYYQDKPKHQRPKKHWFSYRLNKYLEPLAMKHVDGLISVSTGYINTLKNRYPNVRIIPKAVIPFSVSDIDFQIAAQHQDQLQLFFKKGAGFVNLVYVGRAGHDMKEAIILLFKAFTNGLKTQPEVFNKLRFYFIGTSYAKAGSGIKTIEPIAIQHQVEHYVTELTDRISYYESLHNLLNADALIVPGSNDPDYTASKIFPYILAQKPLLAIFNASSSVKIIMDQCNTGLFADLNRQMESVGRIYQFLEDTAKKVNTISALNHNAIAAYSAKTMTEKQCKLFNEVLNAIH